MEYVTVQKRYRLLVDCRNTVSGTGVKSSLQQGNQPVVNVPINSVGLIRLDANGAPIVNSFEVFSADAFEAGFAPAP